MTVTDDPVSAGTPARRKDAEDNRQRLLEVAVTVLFEKPGASLGDIASAAGLARRTLYGHFASREALLSALAADSQATLVDIVTTADRTGRSPEERYALFLLGAWAMPVRTGLLLKVGRTELGVEGVRAVMAPVNAKVAEFVAEGQTTGVFEDHLSAVAMAPALQAINFSLLESFLTGGFDGDAGAAAVTCLMTAGMTRAKAQRVVTRAAALVPPEPA